MLKDSLQKISLTILLTILVSACQSRSPEKKAAVEDAAMYERQNQQKVFANALAFIHQGKFESAKQKLALLIRYNPKHQPGANYYRQLTIPAKQLFGTDKTYRYKIKKGDKLEMLAKRWLGNKDFWVYLARLNNLSDTESLTPGAYIRIPLLKNNPIYQKNKSRSMANMAMVKKMIAQGRLVKAIERITRIYFLAEDQSQISELEHSTLQKLHQLSRSDNARIKLKNELAKILRRSTNRWTRSPIQDLITTLEHSLYFNAAENAWKQKKIIEAAKLLVQAKRYDPERAKTPEIHQMQQTIIDQLHAEAMVSYRNQNLDDALMRWQHVLLLNPDNVLAKKYHARTRKLLEKLKKL